MRHNEIRRWSIVCIELSVGIEYGEAMVKARRRYYVGIEKQQNKAVWMVFFIGKEKRISEKLVLKNLR